MANNIIGGNYVIKDKDTGYYLHGLQDGTAGFAEGKKGALMFSDTTVEQAFNSAKEIGTPIMVRLTK